MPINLYQVSIAFEFEKTGHDLAQKYPKPFLRLLNAAIDPRTHRIPDDLGDVLDELKAADPEIIQEDAFRRLAGAWKMRQSGV